MTGGDQSYTFTKAYKLIVIAASDYLNAATATYTGSGTEVVNKKFGQSSGVAGFIMVLTNVSSGDTITHARYATAIYSLE